MDELIIKTFCLGDIFNNCYLVFGPKSKKGFLIDAPAPVDEILDFVKIRNLIISFIALTHAHFDHIAGLESLQFPFYVHREDSGFLNNSQLNGSVLFGRPFEINKKPRLYAEGMPFYFGQYPIEIIHTPGHTPGGVSLKLNNWLFSGDTLFSGSVGRTDIPGASQELILKSIKEKLLSLPPETQVYPGHGDSTTIGREIATNPFLG
ncbi:MAG: MBL fold metallo-hydrolase [Candidatus Omnitrophota bacterium]